MNQNYGWRLAQGTFGTIELDSSNTFCPGRPHEYERSPQVWISKEPPQYFDFPFNYATTLT
jgi:hypothetical protein